MSIETWEPRILDAPGATERVAAIEAELRRFVAEPVDAADDPLE